MAYEQNLTGRQIAVVVLSAIEWHIIRRSLLTIQAAPLMQPNLGPTRRSSVASSIGNFHIPKSDRMFGDRQSPYGGVCYEA